MGKLRSPEKKHLTKVRRRPRETRQGESWRKPPPHGGLGKVASVSCICCPAGGEDRQDSAGRWGLSQDVPDASMGSVCIQGEDTRRTDGVSLQAGPGGGMGVCVGGHSGNQGCLQGRAAWPAVCSPALLPRGPWTSRGASQWLLAGDTLVQLQMPELVTGCCPRWVCVVARGCGCLVSGPQGLGQTHGPELSVQASHTSLCPVYCTCVHT
jgi:hypothetical protein